MAKRGRQPSIKVGDKFKIKEQYVTVVEYLDKTNIKVVFDDGFMLWTSTNQLKIGTVKSKLVPSVAGVGYVGEGDYSFSSNVRACKSWFRMLHRCYVMAGKEGYLSYKGCSVCKEWHNFQNFAKWFEENFTEGTEGWALDKDLRIKGNKEYSPKACSAVPVEVNCSLQNTEGVDFYYCVKRKKYSAFVSISNNTIFLGRYTFKIDAMKAYKKAKEAGLKTLANKWKDVIHPEVYKTLSEHIVEIPDEDGD